MTECGDDIGAKARETRGGRRLARRTLLEAGGAGIVTLLLTGCYGRVPYRADAAAEGAGEPEWSEQLTRRIPQWMERFRVPGVSIVTLNDARVGWTASFGVRRTGEPAAVDDQTVFEGASLSKPLFACAVMKLVEDGILDPDRPLDAYLPEPYAPEEPATSAITARMVLCHTTGLPNWRKGPNDTAPLCLLSPPGRRFTYSGEGFMYLQAVVEQLTGMGVGSFMQSGLIAELGMARSGYTWNDSWQRNYAHGHDADGEPRNYRFRQRANTAASLYTIPVDYAKYLLAMIGCTAAGEYLPGPETRARMVTPESYRQPGFYHGLGWGLCRTSPRRQIAYHGGSNGSGHRCLCAFEEESGTGFVLMTNGKGGAKLRKLVASTIYPGARLGDVLGN